MGIVSFLIWAIWIFQSYSCRPSHPAAVPPLPGISPVTLSIRHCFFHRPMWGYPMH